MIAGNRKVIKLLYLLTPIYLLLMHSRVTITIFHIISDICGRFTRVGYQTIDKY